MYLILDVIHDLWRILRRGRLPEERIDHYAIVVIVIAWTLVASLLFVLGILVLEGFGPKLLRQPVVVTVLFLSWPALAVGGSLATYRHIHRR